MALIKNQNKVTKYLTEDTWSMPSYVGDEGGGVARHDIGLKGNASKRGVGQWEEVNLKWPQGKFWLEKKGIVYANIWISV